MRKGFTLIEMLVVVAITVAIATAGFLGLAGYRNKQALESGLNELRAAVEGAKRRSVTQEEGSRWGVRFTNATSGVSSYALFKGSSYSVSGLDRTYSFREPVGFGNPSASSTYDVTFTPLTGALTENKVLTLVGGSDGLIGDLILRTVGAIVARNDKNVVGYWHLDEGTSTLAYDASGNANTGTLTNSPTWQSGSNCKAGSCLSFTSASSQYVSLSSGFANFTGGITIEVWAYPTGVGSWQRFIDLGNGSASDNILFARNASTDYLTYEVYSAGSSGGKVNATGAISLNQWQHFAATEDSSGNVILYKNGAQIQTGTTAVPRNLTRSNNYIAKSNWADAYYQGSIDEIRVWDRVLTASEIEAHYNDLK